VQTDESASLLDIARTYTALEAAIGARELTLVERAGDTARISGLPQDGRDFWFLIDVRRVVAGKVGLDCLLPLVMPTDRVDAALDLCLWLSSEGRIRYSLNRLRPCASVEVTLLATFADRAAGMVGAALDLLWERAVAYEQAFRGVAAGASVEAAVAALEDKSFGDVIRDQPWLSVRGDRLV
jgi:hypothetical protein